MAPMEVSMESTKRATATGSRPLGTALLRVSMIPMTPTISTPVPITCRDGAAAQHSAWGLGGLGELLLVTTHLVQEAIGDGDVVSRVGGEDGGGFSGARDGQGPVAVVPDGILGQRESMSLSLATPAITVGFSSPMLLPHTIVEDINSSSRYERCQGLHKHKDGKLPPGKLLYQAHGEGERWVHVGPCNGGGRRAGSGGSWETQSQRTARVGTPSSVSPETPPAV